MCIDTDITYGCENKKKETLFSDGLMYASVKQQILTRQRCIMVYSEVMYEKYIVAIVTMPMIITVVVTIHVHLYLY